MTASESAATPDVLSEHIARVVAEAPPLTAEQRDRIAAIIRAGAAT
ncbi:hypothetical protein [Mycobacterium sp. IS-1556]|nr:hypothetical protein [Mycobacterium sp. IS-1556]